ncbi:MAG: hypothetical protein WAO83_17925 [Fuerstiella sp.]|jgi:Spy/CpxP family protein refolding chaperone
MRSMSVKAMAPVLALFVTVGTLSAVAQQKSSSSKAKTESSEKEKTSKYHRLPTYFGKLELKDEQVQEIYDIKDDFGPKIEDLAKQLADLKAEQDDKIKGVLTRTQVTELNKLKAGTSTKAKTADAEPKSSTKKSSTKTSSAKKADDEE